MTTYNFETRKNAIKEILSKQTLLNVEEYYNSELLTALKAFANALIETVNEKEDASHITIRNLSRYFYEKAEAVGLKSDREIAYAARQIEKLSKRIHSLENGFKGEAAAKRAMFGIDYPNRILNNVEIIVDGEPYEIDFVVVNKSGIHPVEVKNFNKDMIIREDGTLVPASSYGDDQYVKKIRMQMSNQRAALRHVIIDAFGEVPCILENIKSVLLSTGECNITDVLGKENIQDCDSIAEYLNSDTASGKEFTKSEIDAMADVLEKASTPKKYNVSYDYARVADAFAYAVAKIESASAVEISEEKEHEEIFDNDVFKDPETEKTFDGNTVLPEKEGRKVGLKIAGGVAVAVAVIGACLKMLAK